MIKTISLLKYNSQVKGILDHVGINMQASYRNPRGLVISFSTEATMAAFGERQMWGAQ